MSDRPDFNALIGRLRARSAMAGQDYPLVTLLLEAADLLEQAHEVLKTVPHVVKLNRSTAQEVLMAAVLETLNQTADKHESGEYPITTAATAIRAVAAGIGAGVKEVAERHRPGAPKKKPSLVRLHS